jgi:anti-anti-sigma regulatory factor
MKRDLISSATTQNGDARGVLGATVPSGNGGAVSVHERPHLTLVPARLWSHTLIIKGNLDTESAAELEDELECLRQEGVTELTLDLRQLDELDPYAAQVIASHSAVFKGRGRHFAVLVGSPVIDRALAEAGGADLVMHAPTEGTARRFSRSSSHITDLSTTMIRDMGPS